VLKAMLTRGDHPDFETAFALPEAPTYRALYRRTKDSLNLLQIPLLFVTAEDEVRPADRPVRAGNEGTGSRTGAGTRR
jgi:hypothetical protein